MATAKKRKGGSFKVRVCRHCGKRTRGPAHFRHEQACRSRSRKQRSAADGRRTRTLSRRADGVRSNSPTRHFFEQLRRLVQQEIQRQLGVTV
jgi:hypothetical protein